MFCTPNRRQKGAAGKRKPSFDIQEPISSSPPPLLDHSLMLINQEEDEGKRGSGDNSSDETMSVLTATLRVLEMLARRDQDVPSLRATWGEIRKIAERKERR